jgi:hypothetical protein
MFGLRGGKVVGVALPVDAAVGGVDGHMATSPTKWPSTPQAVRP